MQIRVNEVKLYCQRVRDFCGIDRVEEIQYEQAHAFAIPNVQRHDDEHSKYH